MNSPAIIKTAYIMLEIDQSKLAFPYKEFNAIIRLSDLPASRFTERNSITYIKTPSGDYPVVTFTSALGITPQHQSENLYVACFGETEQERLAIACRDHLTLELGTWELTPVPEVMQTSITPILSLLHDGEEVVLISNLDTILFYLEQSETYRNVWNN